MASSPIDPIDPALLDRYFAGETTALETAEVRAFLANSARWQRVNETLASLNLSATERTGVTTDASLERLRTRLQRADDADTGRFNIHNLHTRDLGLSRSSLDRTRSVRLALAFTTLAALIALVISWTHITSWLNASGLAASPTMTREYVVHDGERATIQLADGTHVILGPESRLRYPDHFSGDARTVKLDGTAYFDVAHDPAHPFTVIAGDAVIQELGTAFSATAYHGDSTVRVVVAEGRVALRALGTQPESGTALTRGDIARFNRAGLTTITHNTDLADVLSWTHGVLTFDDAPLGDVARELGRWYDVTFVFASPAIANRPVTMTAGPESLSEVLMQLNTVLGVHATQRGRIVTVTE